MSDPIQEIKDKLDIVDVVREYIPLMPAGKNLKALCPFHKERTPSFIVSPDRQTWHCFGSCNEGGDVFSFVMKYEHVEFYEALQMLAQKAGIELRRISPSSQKEFGILYDINSAAKDYFVGQRNDERAAKYISSRGLKNETLDEFEIGYAPQSIDGLIINLVNAGYDVADIERSGLAFKTERKTYMDRFRGRIMFPIYNTFGKVVGFSGRILPELDNGDSGKYVNSPETPIFNKSRILYGFHKTKQNIREEKTAFLVEGQMDFLMLYQDGVKNCVATSGTALTQHHLEVLKKIAEKLIIAFDSDDAGMIAAERAIDMAHVIDLNVAVFLLSDAKDAAEYIQKNPGKIKHLIESSSMSALDFYFKRYLENVPESEVKNKTRHVLEKILHIYSPMEQSRWVKKIAEKIGLPELSLSDELKLLKSKHPPKASSETGQMIKNADEPPLKTRADKVAMEIILMSLLDESELPKLKDFKMFFPERFAKVIDYLQGVSVDDEEAKALARFAELKSSLRYGDIKMETIPFEINVLIKELKKEFYKEKKEVILEQIRKSEKDGDEVKASQLLREFDELAKLVNN
jgi:DNA primase